MDSFPGPGDYRTYLLRVWREGAGQDPGWRCSLEDPATHARRGFEGVEALVSYLRELYGRVAPGA